MKKQLILIAALAGCTSDPNVTKLQYMPDMADTPSVKAQESYIDPPAHSVPYQSMLYYSTAEQTEKVPNPLESAPNVEYHLQRGEFLYNTYCKTCHGIKADGLGKITDVYPQPPDLRLDAYKQRLPGYFFHVITHGSSIMPSYGHATSAHERWQIVLHLQKLQTL